MNRNSVISGVILIVLAIILGAFGAHALKEKLSVSDLQTFEVGIRYQMYCGIGLLVVGLSAQQLSFSLKPFLTLLTLGSVLFSGSIYLLAMQDIFGMKLSFLGPVTPIGGLLMIAGWILFLAKVLKMKETNKLEG